MKKHQIRMFSIKVIKFENKKSIERQRTSNIKITTENEKKKLKRQKKMKRKGLREKKRWNCFEISFFKIQT